MLPLTCKRILCLGIATCLCCLIAPTIQAEKSPISDTYPENSKTLLAVNINQQNLNQITIFLQPHQNELWASQEDLEKWGIVIPNHSPSLTEQGKIYYCLNKLDGTHYEINHKTMSVSIVFPGKLFKANIIDLAEPKVPLPAKPSLGAFLNYDVMGQMTGGDNSSSSQVGGMFSGHVFNRYGAASTDFLLQRSNETNNSTNNIVRLNTVLVRDDPETMKTMRFGDNMSIPGMWGNSVYFGGMRFGTNFATQPHFIPYPLPSTVGVATLPSSVDLYANNVLLNKQNLSQGPFTLNAIPVLTGGGELNVVTTDLLGRQSVTALPYYVSSTLLKTGLHNTEYDIGWVRQNYGRESNDYGQWMAVFNDQYGTNDKLTREWRGEIGYDQQTLGLGMNYLISTYGVANAAAAVSRSRGYPAGQMVSLGFQHQIANQINYGINTRFASRGFRQIGLQDNAFAPIMLIQTSIGIPLKHYGSSSFSYIFQNNRGAASNHFFGISYSRTFWKRWSFNVSAMTDIENSVNNACFLILTYIIGEQTSANFLATLQKDLSQETAEITRSLPIGTGYGYNVRYGQGQQKNYQASFSAQNDIGTYKATAAQQDNSKGYQLQASGAMAAMGNTVMPSRLITDSFAVVQVPDQKSIKVYHNNQVVSRTNAKGNALVPNLQSYDDNKIRINANDLPLNVKATVTQLIAVPYTGSGVLLRFPAKPSHAVIAHLIQESGEPVPLGAMVTAAEETITEDAEDQADQAQEDFTESENFPVGDDGELYVTDLSTGDNLFLAEWEDHSCKLTIPYHPDPETKETLPDVGKILCKHLYVKPQE